MLCYYVLYYYGLEVWKVAGSCVFIICWRLFTCRTSSQQTYSSVQQAFSRSLTLVWREFSRLSQIDRTVTRWPLVGTGLQNCYTLPRNTMRALTFGTDDFMLVLGLRVKISKINNYLLGWFVYQCNTLTVVWSPGQQVVSLARCSTVRLCFT
jgi:hypothetical protein